MSDPAYPPQVRAYLDRIYHESRREHAFKGETPEDVTAWQEQTRPALRRLLGLDLMKAELAAHQLAVEFDKPEDMGGYTRQSGRLLTEPDVWIPFWLLKPEGDGPFPLALTPHGHEASGHDTSAGIARDESGKQRMVAEDRDVAVQAVTRRFLAIAPATRGIGCHGVPDVFDQYGANCTSQLMHALLAGRTGVGERVWDMERFIDWATLRPDVQSGAILMLGNSGGGMVTTFAAACDPRIGIAIPSCSFSLFVKPGGRISHHDCNMVPGILRFGEFWDVAGLIVPRPLLVVNGRFDPLHDPEHIDMAVAGLRRIYQAAGAAERFEHRYGEGGHRFYQDLMWPFVEKAMKIYASDA